MLINNIIILGLVHAARLILPLLLIPVLTRRIAIDDFGVYMYAIAFSAWLSIFVEYGFNISATREIAGASDTRAVASVVKGVQSAKLLLVVATLPLLLAALYVVPVFQGMSYWAVTAWLLGALTALSPVYYFQGRETLKIVGLTEVICGVMLLIAVYFFVSSADDFPRLALIVILVRGLSLGLLSHRMYRQMRVFERGWFSLSSGVKQLRAGFHLFLFQAAVSLYTSFNVVLLGWFCTSAQVAIYASAERLMRAAIGFLGQFSNAIFPRLNAIKLRNPEAVDSFRLKVLVGFFVLGVVGMGATWVIGPLLVRYMFPTDAQEVDAVLSILAVVIPAIALSNVLGFQYLLVDRKERTFNIIIGVAAAVNVIIAYFLVVNFQVRGMALAWVIIEWLIAFFIALVVFGMGRNNRLKAKI